MISGGAAFFGDVTMYGWSASDGGSGLTCRYDLVIQGRATMTINLPWAEGIWRVFEIGNGIEESFDILMMLADRVVASIGDGARQPAALMRSEQFWFDAARPGQGLVLFELPAARAVLGT